MGGADEPPLVRPYTLTGGRIGTHGHRLELFTHIQTAAIHPGPVQGGTPEYQTILKLCSEPISIAELTQKLTIGAPIIRTLVSDLLVAGRLNVRDPEPVPTLELLKKVRHGLSKL